MRRVVRASLDMLSRKAIQHLHLYAKITCISPCCRAASKAQGCNRRSQDAVARLNDCSLVYAGAKPKAMVNNTNIAKVGRSGSNEADRHCYRPATKTGAMKCDACFEYNKGVIAGSCKNCGNRNQATKDLSVFSDKKVNIEGNSIIYTASATGIYACKVSSLTAGCFNTRSAIKAMPYVKQSRRHYVLL